MNLTELAAGVGIISSVTGGIMLVAAWWLNLKLKPILDRLTAIEKQNLRLEETITLITEGLLNNDQIPRKYK